MRLGSKQIMNADAFHEPTWISDGQPGVIHQHTHAAKNGVVPVSKRIDQGFLNALSSNSGTIEENSPTFSSVPGFHGFKRFAICSMV